MKRLQTYRFKQKVRSLLKGGGDLNSELFDGKGLLYYAIWNGMKKEALMLIDCGIDVNTPSGPDELMPLHLMCVGEHIDEELLRALIAAGADINHPNGRGETPLHVASLPYGSSTAHGILLESNVDIEARDPKEKETPLHLAALWGNYGAAERLLGKGAKVDVTNIDGMTPLHLCVFHCQTHVMRLLLKWHADRNIKNNNGQTPLMIATTHLFPDPNAVDIMIGLLEEKPLPDNNERITSVENASMIQSYTRFIEELPDKPDAYCLRGAVYGEAGLYDLALQDFDHAIELDRGNGVFYLNRGAFFGAIGDIKSAVVDGEKALALGEKKAKQFLKRLTAMEKSI